MAYKHLIYKKGKSEILVIIIDFNYEFSSIKKPIKTSVLKYIMDNKIKFNGNKILLSVGGIVIATFLYTNNNLIFNKFEDKNIYDYTGYFDNFSNIPKLESNEKNSSIKENIDYKDKNNINKNTNQNKKINKKESSNTVNKNINKNTTETKNKVNNSLNSNNKKVNEESKKEIAVNVYKDNGETFSINLEDYVLGVVAAEMPASFNIEALKAQAIIARTYALKSIKNGKRITDNVSTQAFIDTDGMRSKWGSEYSKYYTKVKTAVKDTEGLYITYNGDIIDAVYHSTSNGYTEDASEVWGYSVPYLKSVPSTWDKDSSPFQRTIIKSIEEVKKSLNISAIEGIEILKRNSSGRVSLVKIGNITYSGVELRKKLSLRSTDFNIEVDNDNMIITTKGYGHGVGLSQYGSNSLANRGYNYEKIIKYYYLGININKLL